jgi:hypothetical protein
MWTSRKLLFWGAIGLAIASTTSSAWSYDKESVCPGKETYPDGTQSSVTMKLDFTFSVNVVELFRNNGSGYVPLGKVELTGGNDRLNIGSGSYVDRHTGELYMVTSARGTIRGTCSPIP